jgi:hypothetical protein
MAPNNSEERKVFLFRLGGLIDWLLELKGTVIKWFGQSDHHSMQKQSDPQLDF